VGVSRDCPNFFKYPLLSQERVNLVARNIKCVRSAGISGASIAEGASNTISAN